jgi:hypothetical protein
VERNSTGPTWITSILFGHLVREIAQAQILMQVRHTVSLLVIQLHIAAIATRALTIETVFRRATDGPRGVTRGGFNRELFCSRLRRAIATFSL